MPLQDVTLDDLRFQSVIVDEARKRIARYCPEWTDYNLSDPGITLIELFAWMTEMMVYRLNRVPEKNYVRFLELLGIQLLPARSARTGLTFRLSAPFPLGPGDDTRALVAQGLEIATQETPTTPQVIFTVDEPLYIVPPKLTDVRTAEEFNINWLNRVQTFIAFRYDPPVQRASFYLGFDPAESLRNHIVRLHFSSERTQGTGANPSDPPLVWEVSIGGGSWREIRPSRAEGERDTTGGFNFEEGSITFYLPDETCADFFMGLERTWIRCRYETRKETQGTYSQSPRIRQVRAESLGASVMASHAVYAEQEELGVSSGDPNQVFHVRKAPVLPLRSGETVEVEEMRDGAPVYVPWERVEDFADSTMYDPHYTLDTSTGEVRFGPSIRQPNGKPHQYGRVPQVGRRIRISRYRYGGGAVGNVPPNRLTTMRSAVPFIDRVTNMGPAVGGRDPETLDEAKLRARRELRAQERAVTAEDYESLALQVNEALDPEQKLARVKCITPSAAAGWLPPGMLELAIVPDAADQVYAGDYAGLNPGPDLMRAIQTYLEHYRLLTTTLTLRSAAYVGVRVEARIVPTIHVSDEVVVARVVDALRHYITPLPPTDGPTFVADPDTGEPWRGWPFGKPLYMAELFAIIQRVKGVKHVLEVKISTRTVDPLQEVDLTRSGDASDSTDATAGVAPSPVEGNRLLIAPDALLCSLDHIITVEHV
jgi:predicted phage baseplate assembly protein